MFTAFKDGVILMKTCTISVIFQVNISMLVRYLFQILGSIVIMFTQSAALTGVLLSVVPIVAIGAVQYGKKMSHLSEIPLWRNNPKELN